ncbi:MAG: hypothetical protein LBF58_10670 [Deltaproteobacteria bacterium]|jgi:hypothetical protein|nr:hypothetical protein [Deltaproteobacteria bacterium]
MAQARVTQANVKKFPIIYSFSVGDIDFNVLEVTKDKTWALMAPALGLPPENVTASARQLFELFLRQRVEVGFTEAYSAYTRGEAARILAREEFAKQQAEIEAGKRVANVRGEKAMLASWDSGNFAVYIQTIRDCVKRACGRNEETLPYATFLDYDAAGTFGYYVWKPLVSGEYIPRDFRLAAVAAAEARNQAEREVGNLIADVIEARPELAGFFFEVEGRGTRLPFFELKEEYFGRPKFPLTVKIGQTTKPDRGGDSLYRIRKAEKIEKRVEYFVYPGLTYRLLSVGKGNWVLGQTEYTHLTESCDYLNFKIKSGWLRAGSQGRDYAVNFLKSDPVALEWAGLALGIMNGGVFGSYLAGLAFSAPIFQICGNGNLRLLLAEGSYLKMADYGVHVAPAGMLEYSPGDAKSGTLDLEAFQTIVAKELVEETLLGKDFGAIDGRYRRLFTVMESGPHDFGDPFRARIVRSLLEEDVIPNWGEIWKRKDRAPSQQPLRGALCLNPNAHPSFWVVDSFVLRPEIITPLYIDDDLPSALNWEYEKGVVIDQSFSTFGAVLDYVLQNRNAWTAPGLAALYFGARLYFERKARGEGESLLVTNMEGYGTGPGEAGVRGLARGKGG